MKKTFIILLTVVIIGLFIWYSMTKTPSINFTDIVKIGMCPSDVIKQVGNPYFFEAQLDSTKWKSGTDPQLVIMKQCSAPDESKISLFFDRNGKHKVIFEKGKVVRVEDIT